MAGRTRATRPDNRAGTHFPTPVLARSDRKGFDPLPVTLRRTTSEKSQCAPTCAAHSRRPLQQPVVRRQRQLLLAHCGQDHCFPTATHSRLTCEKVVAHPPRRDRSTNRGRPASPLAGPWTRSPLALKPGTKPRRKRPLLASSPLPDHPPDRREAEYPERAA